MDTSLARPLSGSRVHFVGAGGAGMAALAELLHEMGYAVSGSDLKPSRAVARLRELGIDVHIGPHRADVVEGAEHVVVSGAIPDDNPEVERARARSLDVLSRARLLGCILEAGRGIAVAGTHGKTTTASMLAAVLTSGGFEPSLVIGGHLNDIGSGAALGASDLVVAEADEYEGAFLELAPTLALVTNIDRDHLDHYDGLDAIDDAFVRFLSQRHHDGWAVLNAGDPGVRRVRERVTDPVATFGWDAADLTVTQSGEVKWRGRPVGRLDLRVPGRHNLLNAAGALAAALVLGADGTRAIGALNAFGGVERRFSVRGEVAGVTVVDDYAHNPGKVAATLEAAASAFPEARVVALFQPHLYSRTRDMADDFGRAFSQADLVVVTDVFAAREEPLPGVNGKLIADAITRATSRPTVAYVPRLEEAAGFVAGLAQPGDVVLTLGAGDVTTAAPRILRLLAETDATPT